MSIDRSDVINAYRLLLGRIPENDMVIRDKLGMYHDTVDLCRDLLASDEFNSNENIVWLKLKPTNRESVMNACTLLLGRQPESENLVYKKIQAHDNVFDLLIGLTESDEYKLREEVKIKKNNVHYIVKDKVFNQTPKLIYLHIPKTAGSAFHKLASEYLHGQVSLSMPSNTTYKKWVHSRVVGGHFLYSHYDGMTADRLFLSVVRDPVDRALSLFNYYKHVNDGMEDERAELGFDPTSLKLTIEKSDIDFRGEFVDNYQCLYLSGERNFSAFQKVLEKDKFVVGTFDMLDKWHQFLSEHFGWESTEMPMVNASRKSTYLDELKSDSGLVDMIRELNSEDMKLYEFIKSAGVFTNCGSEFNFDKFTR